ncbi:MAG TPA: hypothetical protein VMB35_00950 [Methanomicrobiales archaeon]|nr:hypothetical protein [Methanomicrobiales archaeon]
MTETIGTLSENFGRELRSFFVVCLLSLVFGALAMAFGLQFIVTAVVAMAGSGTLGLLPLVQVLLGWAAAVVGFRWILSSAGIFRGVNRIRKDYRAMEGPVTDEAVTGLIVRMMAHYRENWKAVWRMNLVAILGGAIFIALGVVNIVQGIWHWYSPSPGEILYLPAILIPLLFAVAIDLAIGILSLLSSVWFRRYARAWELRLVEAGQSEETLKKSMEQG